MTRILESSDAPSAGADTKQQLMKAIAVFPGRPDSVHLAQLPKPRVSDIPGGRGVLVKVLRVGVDGTDKEINAAEYGAAPEGYDFLVTGHESFGRVEAVGENVTELRPDDAEGWTRFANVLEQLGRPLLPRRSRGASSK